MFDILMCIAVIKKPTKYNPYARTEESNTKAYPILLICQYHQLIELRYRPDNYVPYYGQEKDQNQENENEDTEDFFGLNQSQKSAQATSAFPGYQPYL